MSTRKVRQTLSRPRVSQFAHCLFREWERLALPATGDRVIVGVSGGADSTALLLALAELQHTGRLSLGIIVAHLDHGLRKQSKADAEWVARLAEQLNFESKRARANVRKLASGTADNLEQAARQARYKFLQKSADQTGATLVLTAHTMDDQAETFLLRLMRGSGAEGLSGIEAIRPLSPGSKVRLIRPLLSWARRPDTEGYCKQRQVDFRSDQMNEDELFARVKVRKQLLPLMATFNKRIVETLGRTANLLREDTVVLSSSATQLLAEASRHQSENRKANGPPPLNVRILASAPAAVRRHALRDWITQGRGDLRRIEFVHIVAIEQLLVGTQGGRVVELPNGGRVTRTRGWLKFA